jgi:hypothetical protein
MEAGMDRLSSFNSSPMYDGKSLNLKKTESKDSTNLQRRIGDVFEKQLLEGRNGTAKEFINLSESDSETDEVEYFNNSPIQPAEVKKMFMASDEKTAKLGIDRFKSFNNGKIV